MSGLSAALLCSKVQVLAPDLSIQLVRHDEGVISLFAALSDAGSSNITFLSHPKYLNQTHHTQAGAIVLNQNAWQSEQAMIACPSVIVCDNPYAFFAFASQVLQQAKKFQSSASVHPSAVISKDAQLGKNVGIGAFTVIGAGAVIGDNCDIASHVTIGEHVHMGSNTQLFSQVVLYDRVRLGSNNMIHAGTVIGSDGFGFAPYQKRWIKIPQTGTVVIGDDVEIGSNCSIDRGAMGDTIIGRGTKLDNLIQIAHNVHIGEDCAFAANIAIAGSAVLGNRIQIGGNAGVLGHLSVCDDVVISSCTLVTKTISKSGFYSGVYPIQENADWEKNAVALKRLNALRVQVRELEQRLSSSTNSPKTNI
jgi:UDP-3-O-[3-hydroxymyristoyl] glucosamine N-acyltransferase